MAFLLSPTEYGLSLNEMQIILVNIKTLENYKNNKIQPPKLNYILKTLGWKIKRKAIKDLESNNNINNLLICGFLGFFEIIY